MRSKIFVPFSILFPAFLVLAGFFYLQASPDPGPPKIIVSKTVTPDKILPEGVARITLAVKGEGDPQQRFSPVDVMHLIDVSDSMSWFGDIKSQNSGTLSQDWLKIYEFGFDNGLSDFDVLLDTVSADHSQYLRLKSPAGQWFGYQKTNANCVNYSHLQYLGVEYLKVSVSCAESGTWQVWAKAKDNRQYNLVIASPPVRLAAAQQAAKHFVSLMKDQDQIGLVSFNFNASAKQPLLLLNIDANRNLINLKIDSLDASGATAIGKGIGRAVTYLGQSHNGRANVANAIILLSDGKETENSDPLAEAQKAKEAGIKIYTIGLGQADETLLSQIASLTNGQYFKADSGSGLQIIYNQIAQSFSNLAAQNGQIIEILPDYIEYLGNPSEEPQSVIKKSDNTTEIIWPPINLSIGQEKQISFDVKVHKTSGQPKIDVYPDTKISFFDYQGKNQSISFPETFVQIVFQGDAPTPIPSPAPEPPPAPAPTPSPAPAPSLSVANSQASGPGIGSGFIGLVIFNWQISELTDKGAVLSWHTSLPAFCRVIYDFSTHPSIEPGDNFGYSFSAKSATTSANTFHTLVLEGLNASTTYFWKPICRRLGDAKETLGQEQKLTTLSSQLLPESGLSEVNQIIKPFEEIIKQPKAVSIVTPAATSSMPKRSTSENNVNNDVSVATTVESLSAGLFAGIGSLFGRLISEWLFWIILIFLFAFILLLLNFLRKRKEQKNHQV